MNFDLKSVWEQLISRFGGPLGFRIYLQPLMGTFLAIRAGIRDARAGYPPYGFKLLTDSGTRKAAMGQGWKDIARLFVLAVIIDVAYEIIEFRHVYPVQPFIVAAFLAVIPYLLIRGPANRIARRWLRSRGKLPTSMASSTSGVDAERTRADTERKRNLSDKAS